MKKWLNSVAQTVQTKLFGQKDLIAEAMVACVEGNEPLLRKCLKADLSANVALDAKSFSLMHVACRQIHLDAAQLESTVRLLLDRGGNPGLVNDHGETPLQTLLSYALYNVHHRVISETQARSLAPVALLLIRAGSSVSLGDNEDITPLHCAAGVGNFPVVQALLAGGAPVDPLAMYHGTPLLMAINKRHEETAMHLLKLGANPHRESFSGATPFGSACSEGLFRTCHAIIDQGLDLKDIRQMRAFLKAAHSGNIEICQRLLDVGVPLDIVDDKGNTALHMAASAGERETCIWLINSGIDVYAINQEKRTAKGMAHDNGQIHIHSLIDACINVQEARDAVDSVLAKTKVMTP